MKAVMEQRAAERSYGIPHEQLTPAICWSLPALRKARNKLHESARKLTRRIDAGTARIMSATVRRDGGRWHVAFCVEVQRSEYAPARPQDTAGVDVGINHLAMLPTGELVPNPRHLTAARHIADAGLAELRRQLAYKTHWNRGRLIADDRWYPSSKTCSGCGAAKTKLAQSERTYTCTTCGLVIDRDPNAARNLAALAATVTGSGPETLNGRGADRKTRPGAPVAGKRQPGTASAGQTGTVPPQGGTTYRMLARAH